MKIYELENILHSVCVIVASDAKEARWLAGRGWRDAAVIASYPTRLRKARRLPCPGSPNWKKMFRKEIKKELCL